MAGGFVIDRLSAALTLLVASVGAVTYGYSVRYLHGDPGRSRFLQWLAVTVVSAYALMLAAHLVALFAAWSLVSLGLHRLLTHYENRPEATRAARKKFLISRLGDVALVAALVAVWVQWRTLDLSAVLAAVATPAAGAPSVDIVAILVAVAALTKSAQFPFHSWLPETMESPTPVSALMHAGIINAGGALLLRFAPLIAQSPAALLLLSAVGTATLVLGTLAMWAQVKVKRTLAWSTVGQMGFMMTQIGLGAFPAAALHIVAHGCYKAWNFLRCGDVPSAASVAPAPAAAATATAAPGRSLLVAALGATTAVPAMGLASWLTGYSPLHSPGELALAAVLALAAGQIWVAVIRGSASAAKGAAASIGLTVAGALGAFALYRGAAAFLSPVTGGAIPAAGWAMWVGASLPVISLLALVVLHARLPALVATPGGRALRVHALHGFYFGAAADRLVSFVWGRVSSHGKKGNHHV